MRGVSVGENRLEGENKPSAMTATVFFGLKKKIYVRSTIEFKPAKSNSPLLPACIVSA